MDFFSFRISAPGKIVVARYYIGICTFALIAAGYVDYGNGYTAVAMLEGLSGLLCPVVLALSTRDRFRALPAWFAVGFTFVIFLVGTLTQLDSVANLVWLPVFPLFYFYLTNLVLGTTLSVFSLLVILASYYGYPHFSADARVPAGDIAQVVLAFGMAAAVAFLYEKVRSGQERALARQSEYDYVTNNPNRWGLTRIFSSTIEDAMQSGSVYFVVVCRIDGYRDLAASHGSAAVDQLARSVSTVIKSLLNTSWVLGRWSDDRFMILLPETSQETANRFVEDLRGEIGNHVFPDIGLITVSQETRRLVRPEDIAELIQHLGD
jgi:diguanylate cyclase (GGDEF)-like protein